MWMLFFLEFEGYDQFEGDVAAHVIDALATGDGVLVQVLQSRQVALVAGVVGLVQQSRIDIREGVGQVQRVRSQGACPPVCASKARRFSRCNTKLRFLYRPPESHLPAFGWMLC